MFILSALVIYFFRMESLSRLVLFGTIAVYTIMEISIFTLVFIGKMESVFPTKSDISDNINSNIFGQELLSTNPETEYKGDSNVDIQSLFNGKVCHATDGPL